ncbi:hypothetical protein [Pelosinus sp. IPA-1]|uniref:hypothetical protein n=1 Tax=Pelosinus sp. IPA-1 TaxID=3029569 RepID=UPI0024361514|nr:hypothetical protein [Pelosinus sp. IPA-1]GMB00432.1 hypothetical protein PIPA1_32310 [Pelosinus sp. IPA-1]
MKLKDLMAKDIDQVFFNEDQFAETHTLVIEDVTYNIPLTIEHDVDGAMQHPLEEGWMNSITLYFSAKMIKRRPVKGQLIEFDKKDYVVADCFDDCGCYELRLEVNGR